MRLLIPDCAVATAAAAAVAAVGGAPATPVDVLYISGARDVGAG